MSDPAGARPARLFTTHGTVLFVDESGQLRHGPIENSPANAVFAGVSGKARSTRSGSITCLAGASEEPVVCSTEACWVATAPRAQSLSSGAITLELVPLERGLMALRADGKFLCAGPGGSVALSRPVCSTWECFLASESWFSAMPQDMLPTASAEQIQFDVRGIQRFILDPMTRIQMNAASARKKIVIYADPQGAQGRIYYDLSKRLHGRGYVVDILDWRRDHVDVIARISAYYDLFLTTPDGVSSLINEYGIAPERMMVVTQHEMDIRYLVDVQGREIFDKFAAYAAISSAVYTASTMLGVRRSPRVVPVGVDYAEFYADVPEKLQTVGYASPLAMTTFGIEWKRGHLAEAAAREASLAFRTSESVGAQASFHETPGFYRSVDAVLMSSLSEGGPVSVLEAAAAGRLVIGTPVGHFPLRAYQGGGIIAPIEPEKFVAFAAATLKYYRDNPADFVFKCLAIQEAARQFDWSLCIDDWVELIESA